tara:strand:- start:3103 stop:4902 length:1800 start_codon:yes stop_codon:yes gene_type:complete
MSNKSIEEVLNYPFNVGIIFKKKKEIKRVLLQQADLIDKRVAILGGSTTAEIKNILELFLLKEGIKPSFYESEYNRYYEDVMFENTTLQMFRPEIIYIHTSNVNIVNSSELTDSAEEIQAKIYNEFSRYTSLWGKAAELYKCPIIQNNFELPATRTLGNLEFSDIHGKINYILRLNLEFAKYAQANNNFYINDIHYLSSWIGLEKWHNNTFWYSYKYALDYESIPILTHNIAKIISAIFGKTKKCLVLDLDNTLWGGEIGEDGIRGIQVGSETPTAEAFKVFQEYLKTLKNRGVLLTVCSKNQMENAIEGISHPDNVLKTEDFVAFYANWKPKYQNIVEIAKELNIGLDSLVFVDDDAVERELVKTQLPMVITPDIGNDVTRYVCNIEKNLFFEPILLSEDDIRRSQYYEENSKRDFHALTFQSYDEFLISLKMEAEIKAFSSIYLERITQLTNKTNQFNLTTKRFTVAEMEAVLQDQKYITLYGRLRDKFGDNGIVSALIGMIQDDDVHIDVWLMSCRVIKRGLEYAMFDELVKACLRKSITTIKGYYIKTAKNVMVATHYREMGFQLLTQLESGDSEWRYTIPADYIPKANIKVVNE